METIASFEVDHTVLKEGVYISRTDGDIVTYDLRVTRPNETFLPCAAIHTVEHLFAVHARNGKYGPHIVYFGPMGCRTGFYLLTRNLPHEDAVSLIKETFAWIASYEGAIPGVSAKECGNYREHDLAGAKAIAAEYYEKIQNWTVNQLNY